MIRIMGRALPSCKKIQSKENISLTEYHSGDIFSWEYTSDCFYLDLNFNNWN